MEFRWFAHTTTFSDQIPACNGRSLFIVVVSRYWPACLLNRKQICPLFHPFPAPRIPGFPLCDGPSRVLNARYLTGSVLLIVNNRSCNNEQQQQEQQKQDQQPPRTIYLTGKAGMARIDHIGRIQWGVCCWLTISIQFLIS